MTVLRVVVSRTVLPSLENDAGRSHVDLTVDKALDHAYQWIEFSGRFAVYVEERSRCGKFFIFSFYCFCTVIICQNGCVDAQCGFYVSILLKGC